MEALKINLAAPKESFEISSLKKATTKKNDFHEVLKTTQKEVEPKEEFEVKEKPRLEKNRKLEADKKVVKKDEVKETEKTNDTDKEEKITEEEKIKKISEELGVEVSQIENILQTLNLNVEDLKEPENLKAFVSELLGVEGDMELIKHPEALNLYKEIEEVVSVDFKPKEMITIDMSKFNEQSTESEEKVTDYRLQITDDKEQLTVNKEEKIINNEQELDTKVEEGVQETEEGNAQDNSEESGQEEKGREKLGIKTQTKEVKIENNVESSTFSAETIMKPQEVDDIVSVSKTETTKVAKKIINQVVENVKVNITEDKSEMVIKLKPDHLGKLALKIASENGTIAAKINVESAKVKEMIESNIDDLKESLRQQGLSIDSLEVSVGSENQSEQRNIFEYERKRSKLANKRLIDSLMGTEGVEETKKQTRIMTENKIDYIA